MLLPSGAESKVAVRSLKVSAVEANEGGLADGRPWDLDPTGGLLILGPFTGGEEEGFAEGNADALWSHRRLIRELDADIVLDLGADLVYTLDYPVPRRLAEGRTILRLRSKAGPRGGCRPEPVHDRNVGTAAGSSVAHVTWRPAVGAASTFRRSGGPATGRACSPRKLATKTRVPGDTAAPSPLAQ